MTDDTINAPAAADDDKEQNWASRHAFPRGDLTVLAYLERRVAAASCDASIVAVCCLFIFLSFGPLTPMTDAWVGWLAAAVVAAYALLETFTGVTPGKRMFGLAVRSAALATPPLSSLVVRSLVKLVPVFLFVPVLFASHPLALLAIVYLFVTGGSIAIACCYMFMMRRGKTLFDAVSGTVVAVTPLAPKPRPVGE